MAPEDKRLFLLDGMALVYRGHFALIARPIFTSKGVNSSALYVFTQTLLDILNHRQPTHIAVAFDTAAPTHRDREFAEYKAKREAMPEDISAALPHVRRLLEAFNIPALTCDGFEADDIIGTLVRKAEQKGFVSYMVTPDKDFGQLVDTKTFMHKPSRMGDGVEILGVPEILSRWGIQEPKQVIDIIALWGDASDNIPGVPGIGEKTAGKLIGQYGSVENLLAHTHELKGKLKENLETFREQALLSKRLATIHCEAPCPMDLESLRVRPRNDEAIKEIFVEFEFNALGRRLFGDGFKAGRGFQPKPAETEKRLVQDDMFATGAGDGTTAPAQLKTISDVPHEYQIIETAGDRAKLFERLRQEKSFAFHVLADDPDPRQAKMLGVAFALAPHSGFYVPQNCAGVPPVQQTLQREQETENAAASAGPDRREARPALGEDESFLQTLRELLEDESIEKVGHDLKVAAGVLRWHGITLRGKLFDTMLAHSLIEPELRHSLEYLAEAFLGYQVAPLGKDAEGRGAPDAPGTLERGHPLADHAIEAADVALQLRGPFEAMLKDRKQERVFYEIELPLMPALVEMEFEGIRVDAAMLAGISAGLEKELGATEKTICATAGREFNINSPRQLGQILFDVLKICEKPKRTRTGQYATDEQTLLALESDHPIVRQLLEHRAMSKLKSTYADALPASIWPKTGRIHTTYFQTATTTGRLNSQNPNLQNIPIRSDRGQEIREAFVPRDQDWLLLSADYSQIELRIIAALSREAGLLEAFHNGTDVHTATAARVFGVSLEAVTSEMRRQAKMVNYGIAYGISAFGLAQRLGIPRAEAAGIIDAYFTRFSGIRKFMTDTVAFTREHGYAETVTGRRRYIRDINSRNATLRNGAERNAINAPIQGTAADMIKIAMIHIHGELARRRLKTKMLLQVHDELLFDLYQPEEEVVLPLVEEKMKTAIALDVPIVVEMGTGENWLAAH